MKMDFQQFRREYEKKEVQEISGNPPEKPMVSVCVQTFQQASYIRECLDSILMQKVSFPIEILVGEDESTDGTRDICREYFEKYPGKIRLFLHHSENKIRINGRPTGRFNLLYNLYAARGKYIAFCEGDDYWIDPLKLEKQVRFLEENKDYILCYTNAKAIDGEGRVKEERRVTTPEKSTFTHLELLPYAPTLTRVFRNQHLDEIPLIDAPGADTKMLIGLSRYGKIKYLDVVSAAYREHAGGIFNSQGEEDRMLHQILTRNASLELVETAVYMKYLTDIIWRIGELQERDAVKAELGRKDLEEKFKRDHHRMSFLKKRLVKLQLRTMMPPATSGKQSVTRLLNSVLVRL